MTGGYIMKEKNIQELAIRMGLISVEDMCQYTIAQLVVKIANKVNELVGEVWRFETDVQEMLKTQNENIQYLLGEGLHLEVENIFDGWVQDGTFDTLLNQSALKKVNDRIDETNAQLSSVALDVLERAKIVNSDVFTITNDIYIPKRTLNTSFLFDGKDDIKIDSANGGKLKATTKENSTDEVQPFRFKNSNNIAISNVTIEGLEGEFGSPESLILIENCSNVRINNLKFITRGGYTLILKNCSNVVIDGCDFNKGSVWIVGGNNIKIINNTFKNTYYDCVKGMCHNLQIIGNSFYGSGQDAIDTYYNGQNIIIADNYIENCGVIAIQIKNVLRDSCGGSGSSDVDGYDNRIIVTNNIIKDSPYGISVKLDDLRVNPQNDIQDMPKLINIHNNFIENCERAIYGKHVKCVSVNNNHIMSSGERGIMFAESFSNVSIQHNILEECNDGVYLVPSSTTLAKDVVICGNILNLTKNVNITYRGTDGVINNNQVNDGINGIHILYPDGVICSGNVVRNLTGVGFRLTNNFEGSVLTNNITKSCATSYHFKGNFINSIIMGNCGEVIVDEMNTTTGLINVNNIFN